MPNVITPDTKSAPAEAFRFALPVAFADAGEQRDSILSHRINIQARTPGVVNHWYWGRIVHDMSGARHKDRIPIDWNHSPDEILGYGDQVTADANGLQLVGILQSIREGDRSWEVITRGRAGQPYESSIYWDEENNILEYLDAGFVTDVNGQQVEGPLIIAREWLLRGIALCPYGVDATSKTQFSADGRSDVSISLRRTGEPMSTKKPDAAEPTKDAAAQTSQAPATQSPEQTTGPAQQTTGAPAEATRDAARGELARYMERFGTERGAEYFRDSIDYPQACEREIEHLRKQLATKDAEIKSATDKLSALNLGETTPVDTGAQNKDSQKAAPTWESCFKKAGT